MAKLNILECWQNCFDGGVFLPSAAATKSLETRERIVLAAFAEIHRYGYQAASIQNIIDQAGVTKGALYHHFASKRELVMAVIDEVHAAYIEQTFIAPLAQTDDPVNTLLAIMKSYKARITDEEVSLGCPVDTLSQEIAPIDPEMQQKIDALYAEKQKVLVAAFERGQAAGKVRAEVDAAAAALMVRATLQGCMGIAKSAKSVDALLECGYGLIQYLLLLQPDGQFAGEAAAEKSLDCGNAV